MSVQVIGSGTIGGIDEGLVVSGIVTATELDISGNIDVDGHTNLDNVSVSGATTCTGGAVFLNSISLNASTNNYLYFNDNLNFTRNGHGNEMTIDSSGRIGVGVVPTAQYAHNLIQIGHQATLGANAALSATGQTFLTHNLYFDTGGTFRVFNTSNANEGAIFRLVDGQLLFSNSAATTGTPTVTERFRITSAGSVWVKGGNLQLGSESGTDSIIHTTNAAGILYRADENGHRFQTYVGGWQDRLVIRDGGDVGIGTNLPVERVHIHKASATGPFMYITNTSTGVSASDGIQIGYDGTNTAVFKNNEPTDLVFYAGSQSFRITSSGHVLPDANNTQDLGSSSKRWRNVYTTDLQLSNKGKTNDVDNTWGDYTIQEGESDLFLINNRNGKKYKFNLTEVS